MPTPAPTPPATEPPSNRAARVPSPDASAPLEPVKRIRKRAKKTKAQKAVTKEHTAKMWTAIRLQQEKARREINTLAEEWNRSTEFMATQVYAGGKVMHLPRDESLFNAYIFDQARLLREKGEMKGRGALAELTKKCAADGEWKDLDGDEQEWLLSQLRAHKATKLITKSVTHAASGIQGTMARVNPELEGMAYRSNAQVCYGILRSSETDAFDVRTFCTPQINEAMIQCFKHTYEEIFLKVDAFIVGGLAGVLALKGQNKVVRMRTEIRERVLSSLVSVLQEQRHIKDANLPRQMSYAHYLPLVAKWGVELAGWTEDEIRNPGFIQTSGGLKRLLDALNKGHCYWRVLSQEEWDKKVEEKESADIDGKNPRKRRKDFGSQKGPQLSKKAKRSQEAAGDVEVDDDTRKSRSDSGSDSGSSSSEEEDSEEG